MPSADAAASAKFSSSRWRAGTRNSATSRRWPAISRYSGLWSPRAISSPNSERASAETHPGQPGRPGPDPETGQRERDQPDEADVLTEQRVAVVGQQGVEGQLARGLVLLVEPRGCPPAMALQQQGRQQLPGEQQPKGDHGPTKAQGRGKGPAWPAPETGGQRPGHPVGWPARTGYRPLLRMAGQQLQPGRDPTEHHPAQPSPLQGQVADSRTSGIQAITWSWLSRMMCWRVTERNRTRVRPGRLPSGRCQARCGSRPT